jgi:SAM-dependent methyltransferase
VSWDSPPPGPVFHTDRPSDIHNPRPWSRFGYIMSVLPRRLEALSRDLGVPVEGRVLDYGSADAPYRHFFSADVDFVVADLPGNPKATMVVNPDGTLPADDASFDAVLSTQVLEHVAEPKVYLAECYRVLRPGGRLLLSTHGFMIYHADPDDYWRWTWTGLQRVVQGAGFELVSFEGIMGMIASGLQLIQESVYWHLPRRLQPVIALPLQSLMRLSDRFQGAESRKRNALVYALLAEKPRDF